MERQEPFLLISESDLSRLFYYGNRDHFPCNWFQIGRLGVRSPNAPLDVIPSDTCVQWNESILFARQQCLDAKWRHWLYFWILPSKKRQVPSLPRRLRGDNATELFSNHTCQIVELFTQTAKLTSTVFPTNSGATIPKQVWDKCGWQILAHPAIASLQLIDTSDKEQFTKRLRNDKGVAFVLSL